MASDWSSESDKVKEAAPNRADAFAAAHFPLLSELQFTPPHLRAVSDFSIFSMCWALTGAFILLAGFFVDSNSDLIKVVGVSILVLTAPIYVLERLARRQHVRFKMRASKGSIEEVRRLRREVGKYLGDLDQRTSRYFHCVTNSKVTTYFMLRQIENSLGELTPKLDTLSKSGSAAQYARLLELLRGTLQYRDGFEFNSGRTLHVPMYMLATRVQELVTELEKGINALESEIENYREQAQTNEEQIEDEKQIPLEFPASANER